MKLLNGSAVVSTFLRPPGQQYNRLPCPSPTPRICSNSCPLSQWCHPTISSSVVPFSSCPQSFPVSESFPTNQFFASGGQSIYWSFSFNISPSSEYSALIFFRMGWLDLLAVQGTLKTLLQYHSAKASVFKHSAFLTVQLSHPYMITGKVTFISKVMSLLFNMLSRLVIAFIPRSKHLLFFYFYLFIFASFNFMAAVTICSDFGAQENKVCPCFHCSRRWLMWQSLSFNCPA